MYKLPSCCVCLCVFNNQVGLPPCLRNILALNRTNNLFSILHIAAFYDESTDASLQILTQFKQAKQNLNITIIQNPNPQPNKPRTQRIAQARNGLLNHIRENFPTIDYFIMMDTNDYSCVGKIRPQVIRLTIQDSANWDAVSFDREDGYYDYFALRYNPYIYSLFHFGNWVEAKRKLVNHFSKILIKAKQVGAKYIPVLSAFNGFAIYKTSVFLNCTYDSNIDLGLYPPALVERHESLVGLKILKYLGEDCEHCRFHAEAVKHYGAKIRISLNKVFDRV
jgi:hypothetical protein